MPQREFWTHRHACEVVCKLKIDPTDPDSPPWTSFSILDQAGSCMAWTAGSLPSGFSSWAFADAVRSGVEAFDLSTPEDALKAFSRTRSQWVKDAKGLLGKSA